MTQDTAEAQVFEVEQDSEEVQDTQTGGESQAQAESEDQQQTKTKGEPSDEKAYARINSELKETKRLLKETFEDKKVLLDGQKRLEQQLEAMQNANKPAETYGIESPDEEFATAGETKQAVGTAFNEITALKNELGSIKTDLQAWKQADIETKVKTVNANGAARFKDWEKHANIADALMRRDGTFDQVFIQPDPAKYVYELGGGKIEQTTQKPNNAKQIAQNQEHPPTLTKVPSDNGSVKLTFEQILALPEKEWAKVPENVREAARKDYIKRTKGT